MFFNTQNKRDNYSLQIIDAMLEKDHNHIPSFMFIK